MLNSRHLALSLHDGALDAPAQSIDRPQRIVSAMDAAASAGNSNSNQLHLPTRRATLGELTLVHQMSYVEGLRRQSESGTEAQIDPELVVGPHSFDAAAAAAGAMLEMAELYARRRNSTVPFCLSRPGSHHAGNDYGMGFCLFNNLAVTARHALVSERAERVAILDFDAHHGNGTEQIFSDRPDVLTISIHQYPFFPGSGAAEDSDAANLNLPLAAGAGDAEGREAFARACDRILDFAPDLLLLEAGMDAHEEDWTTELGFTDETFESFGRQLSKLVDEAGSALLIEAGGGYTKRAMEGGMSAFLYGLL